MEIGFLAPNGDFYKCQPFEHIDLARKICLRLNYEQDIKELKELYTGIDCENYLIAQGFLEVCSRSMNHSCIRAIRIGEKYFPPIKLSDIQEQFLEDNLDNAFNNKQLDSMYNLLNHNDVLTPRRK